MDRGDSGRLLVGAGLVAWVVAGLPLVTNLATGRTTFDGRALASCAALGVFGVAYLFAAATRRFVAWRAAALVVQSVAALAMVSLDSTHFAGVLLCVVAGEAPLLVGEKRGLALVVAQTAAMATLDLATAHTRATLFSAVAYAGFQLFAFGASRLAVREAAGRAELARVHAELLATRELFADSTRTAERLRIARELHDALGHNLTALSLQLELARNLAEGRAKEPVDRAHGLTKELLVELRTVVSAMREDPRDRSPARGAHARGRGPAPARAPRARGGPPRRRRPRAHHLPLRPGGAHERRPARGRGERVPGDRDQGRERRGDRADDGRGAAEVQAGHGLSGLRERIEGMGGSVEDRGPARAPGSTLRAMLPARAGAA